MEMARGEEHPRLMYSLEVGRSQEEGVAEFSSRG